ncbi:MAG: hypothetical protein ACXAC5_01930 [Promethearchaeota archaeon]
MNKLTKFSVVVGATTLHVPTWLHKWAMITPPVNPTTAGRASVAEPVWV